MKMLLTSRMPLVTLLAVSGLILMPSSTWAPRMALASPHSFVRRATPCMAIASRQCSRG
jgi:hypothetical protein